MEFYQTVMGKRFYEATMPKIAKSLERIADSLEETDKEKRYSSGKNELCIFLPNDGFMYAKTEKSTITSAIKDAEERGLNIDNITYRKIVLRNDNGIYIDIYEA